MNQFRARFIQFPYTDLPRESRKGIGEALFKTELTCESVAADLPAQAFDGAAGGILAYNHAASRLAAQIAISDRDLINSEIQPEASASRTYFASLPARTGLEV